MNFIKIKITIIQEQVNFKINKIFMLFVNFVIKLFYF